MMNIIKLFRLRKWYKESSRIFTIYRQGNSKRATQEYVQLMNTLKVQRTPPGVDLTFTVANNLANCYIVGDDFDSAIALYKEIEPEVRYLESANKVVFRFNLAHVYLMAEQIDDFSRERQLLNTSARESIDEHEILLAKASGSTSRLSQALCIKYRDNIKAFENFIKTLDIGYAIYEGDFDEPLAYYKRGFFDAPFHFWTILPAERLAYIYQQRGEMDKHVAFLRYLSQSKFDWACVSKAKETLQTLPEALLRTDYDIYAELPCDEVAEVKKNHASYSLR